MAQERILVVDDEKNIVSSLQQILTDEGYDTHCAHDGLDALDMVQADPPDLVILDIWIPGMDGIEVLKTLKSYYPDVEVLVMSGHGTIDTAVKATKLGASDFIEKPFSLNHIVQSVGRALREKKSRNGHSRPRIRPLLLPHCFHMMADIEKSIKKSAKGNFPVLIQGEKGTGKEFIAQAIHDQSRKLNMPFLKLNCATRTMPQIKAELFAPTDKKPGSGNAPSKSHPSRKRVVFLKNVDSLSKALQEKLAKALKSGSKKSAEVDLLPARVFASTTCDLEQLAKKGQFHPDLFEVFKNHIIYIPPLREQAAIIPSLVENYFQDIADRIDAPTHRVTEEAMEVFREYDWPENLKEMRMVLDQLTRKVHPEDEIEISDIPIALRNSVAGSPAISKPTKSGHSPQRTLKRSVVLCGSGLHSGYKTGLIMQPLPAGSGIIFGDISTGETIPARLENVQSTEYATCLKKGRASVSTIEHIMATLHMYGIHNLLIKIGDEAPVMDGSAKDFCQLVEDGEFEDQEEASDEIVIDKKYSFGDGGDSPHISIEPYDGFKVSYHMDYPAPIGVMDHEFEFKGSDSFKTDIAPARTFGFMKDVAQLTKMGFAAGGKLDNFILLDEQKVLNTELRYDNEFARHKILDILGDFYLLGKPVRGHIRAHKSGHTQNIGLLKQIQSALC